MTNNLIGLRLRPSVLSLTEIAVNPRSKVLHAPTCWNATGPEGTTLADYPRIYSPTVVPLLPSLFLAAQIARATGNRAEYDFCRHCLVEPIEAAAQDDEG